MARELAATESQVQATIAGSLVGLGLGQIITGPLSDALGRQRPVLVGVALHILSSLLCAIAPNVTLLIVFRLVQGLAGTAGKTAATAVVRDLFVGRRAAVLYWRMALIMGLTPVVAPPVSGFMLAVTSWRGGVRDAGRDRRGDAGAHRTVAAGDPAPAAAPRAGGWARR